MIRGFCDTASFYEGNLGSILLQTTEDRLHWRLPDKYEKINVRGKNYKYCCTDLCSLVTYLSL